MANDIGFTVAGFYLLLSKCCIEGESLNMIHEQLFTSLWNEGYRFLDKDQENDTNTGLFREFSPGRYEVITIRGMKEMAKEGALTLDGNPLTEEEVEILWNAIAFMKNNKNK